MNTLGFLIEQNNDGYNYFYTVDGIKLKYKDFRPARYRTILDTDETDWDFEDNSMVILNECGCGFSGATRLSSAAPPPWPPRGDSAARP